MKSRQSSINNDSKSKDTIFFISSDLHTAEQACNIVRQYYQNVVYVFWEMGNSETKQKVRNQLDKLNYNIIVSYFNGFIFQAKDLDKAQKGAINIHPAPPEHPGCWGTWCQPIIRRDIRTHHGITIHEIDKQVDHGDIYFTKRWQVPEDASIQSVEDKSGRECLHALEKVIRIISRHNIGTAALSKLDEKWDINNAHHKLKDIKKWFATLPHNHPAHKERVWFNHPKGLAYPPYFSDLL